MTHTGIFVRISLVRAFSLCQNRWRFQEREKDTRDNTIPSPPADVSLITRDNGATLERDEKPRTNRDVLMKDDARIKISF